MRVWIEEGINVSCEGVEVGLAFFSLESLRSLDLLEALLGQIHLGDYKRVFELYTEGFCSKKLGIDTIPIPKDKRKNGEHPQTHGHTIV